MRDIHVGAPMPSKATEGCLASTLNSRAMRVRTPLPPITHPLPSSLFPGIMRLQNRQIPGIHSRSSSACLAFGSEVSSTLSDGEMPKPMLKTQAGLFLRCDNDFFGRLAQQFGDCLMCNAIHVFPAGHWYIDALPADHSGIVRLRKYDIFI